MPLESGCRAGEGPSGHSIFLDTCFTGHIYFKKTSTRNNW